MIFVSATLLGFASHAPGGLGVFDAAMLVALWQFDKEDLLAGLLLFRLLYYIVPFALSLLILGAREILTARGRDTARAAGDIAADVLVPASVPNGARPRPSRTGSRRMIAWMPDSGETGRASFGSTGSSARGWCWR